MEKAIDLNHDLNQWFKSRWFKSANPVRKCDLHAQTEFDTAGIAEQNATYSILINATHFL